MNAEPRQGHADRPLLVLHSAFCVLSSKPLYTLTALTLLAALIRFLHLSHPCLWYDESMVYWRICGSYGQLLDCLRTDGFVPLHYTLDWLLTRILRPTPFTLRLIPALSGTLMVPAIYFLARQLVNTGTSLLAAAFAACSAFLLFYSRDAKMYQDAWLLVTLNMACLLWWLRAQSSTAWLSWVASGCAACGVHFTAAIPVAISLLLLLTQSKTHWKQILVWLAGLTLILAGPLGYYSQFNHWEDRVDEQGWRDSGLQWIGAYNYGRSGPELARVLATSTLIGWEWPKDMDVAKIPPDRFQWPARAAELLLILAIASGLPWRTWVDRRMANDTPHPAWRLALWLCFWIILPAYGFYCRSVNGFWSPSDWQWLWQTMPIPHLWPILFALILIGLLVLAIRSPSFRQSLLRGVHLLLVAIVILALCQLIASIAGPLSVQAIHEHHPWQSIWVPRYLGFIWPALAIAVAALIMRLPYPCLRAAVIFFLLGTNLFFFSRRLFGSTEPPTDMMAQDKLLADNLNNHILLWTHMKRGPISPGGGNLYSGPGEYYLDILSNAQTTPAEFKKSLHTRTLAHTLQLLPSWRTTPKPDIHQLIIWDESDANQPDQLTIPPAPWHLLSQQSFTATDYWIWQDLLHYHRALYTRP